MKLTAYIKNWSPFPHIGVAPVRSVSFVLTGEQVDMLEKLQTGTRRDCHNVEVLVYEDYSHHFLVTDDGNTRLVVVMANHQRMIDFQEPITHRYITIEFTEKQRELLKFRHGEEDYFGINIEGIE